MAEEIKICKLIIKGYDQFKDIELDFTDPKTGEPLEKICFIGRNGTGKSKLLKILDVFLSSEAAKVTNALFAAKLKVGEDFFYCVKDFNYKGILASYDCCYKVEIEKEERWLEKLASRQRDLIHDKYYIRGNEVTSLGQSVSACQSKMYQKFLLIYCPPEDENNPLVSLTDVPKTSLGEALYDQHYILYNQVSPSTVSRFWERLMYLIEMRRQENEIFEQNNLDKTKRQLIEEFDKNNPKILDKIADVWNKILAKAGLEFDIENAKVPLQISENLQAYLRLKNSKQRVNYNALSTGIRNFIFKIGHIYSLYFDREVISGVLLLDEPENSLYPDFLYDLIDIYRQATTDKRGISNTQIFVATHSPIIAAQFRPEERIILEFDDEGGVTARRGNSPEGDDPNDVLKKDFAVRSLLGKRGIEKWDRYLDLKSKLHANPKSTESNEWRKEFLKIGEDYNFES
jgi:predicted ATP-dependent endonuclease of OLD family